MSVQLNHTIVLCRDRRKASEFVAWLLGLAPPKPFGPFYVIELANGVSLDYHDHEGDFSRQHYAFLVTEPEFDAIFARLRERGMDYWADPRGQRKYEINHHDGGRGVYFQDLDGHYLEAITRPYGSGG